MIHSFKIIFRNFIRKPVYSLITLLGFTLGVMASLLIYLWVLNELNYEKFHPDYDRIYRVLTLAKEGDEVVKSAGCYRPVAKTLKMTYPQIENATYLSFDSEDSPLKRDRGGEKIEARCMSTNEDFFDIFGGFTFIEGTPEKAFSNPSSTVLSEEVARKLFGNEPAMGKIVVSDKFDPEIYTVSGVVRIPKQSHIDFGFIVSGKSSRYAFLEDSWGDKAHVRVYIKLAKNAVIDDKFQNAITNHLGRFTRMSDKLVFQALTDIHLHTNYQTYHYDKNISNSKYVWIFSGLALLIVLMAALNFSVLSVARSSERSTEIGIKKVCGAERPDIIRQFMGEAVMQTTAATLIALFFIWLILPWFNVFTGQSLTLNLSFGLMISMLLLTVLVGIVAGIYPSVYLSSLKTTKIFRGGSQTGSKSNFTRMLVVIQFSIATFFVVATSVFIKQLNYIQGKDLGFDRKNIVVIPTGLWYENKSFKDELLKNPNILGVTATAYAPVDFNWQVRLAVDHAGRSDSIRAAMIWADEDFAKTYKLELIRGQFLQIDFNGFWNAQEADTGRKPGGEERLSIPVVINEAAEKSIGYQNPIGERIGNYVIAGVVKDFHFRPLHYPIGPLIITYDPQNIMTMNVRIAGNNKAETLKFIRDAYQKHRNSRGFSYSYFDDLLAQKYQDEVRLRNLTLIFSALAIIIAMLGILGMAVFSCDRRTKEIGIRKANGASMAEILFMLNKEFLKWVVVAFVIAIPVAWYAMHRWLENFAYRTELSWWIFVPAACLIIVTALVAVNWQTFRVARRNPVKVLKYE
jgi:putative ABC transport system permease protein